MSERFPALTPFRIRREKCSEVLLLVSRLRTYDDRETMKEAGGGESITTTQTGERIIRRPATDSWF